MSFAISTDTSANLPTAELQWHRIYLLPFSYIVNDVVHQCLDLTAFDGDAYYASLRHMPATTSMVTVDQYCQLWQPLLERGEDVLHLCMSSGISGAYQSAVIAARQLREEYPRRRLVVFDTRAASLGEGIQVLHAAICREADYSLDATVRELTELRGCIRQVFTVDDLMHLRRGGRVSGVTAAVGAALRIKPILKGDAAGRIVVSGKVQGRKRSIHTLADHFAANADLSGHWPVGIAHAGCQKEALELAALIKRSDPGSRVMVVDYEPVTGSHVGPGALALFYVARDDG